MRLYALLLMFVLAGCGQDNPVAPETRESSGDSSHSGTASSESLRFNAWLDREYADELEFTPLLRTRQGDKSDYDKLDDVSEAALDRRLDWRRDSVARMREGFDRQQLDDQAKLSWDLWEYALADDELNLPFRRHSIIFGRRGPQSDLPRSLIAYHDVESLADMQAYVSRLRESGRYMLQYLERAKLAAADGIRAPYFDYEVAIDEIGRITDGAPFTEMGESAIWEDATAKIDGLRQSGAIDEAQADDLRALTRDALRTRFKPAYDEVLEWLQSDLPNVPAEARGAWSLPDGDAYYSARLRSNTTVPLSAREVHEIGIAEVARIHAEMERIREQVGFDGTLQEFFDFVRDDDRFYLPNTDEGRAEYLRVAEELVAGMSAKLPDYFGILPRAGLQVKRVEAFREQPGGSAHYARGTRDGSRPGTFYVHLIDMRAAATYRLEGLVYHEGVPGHHMQISIQQELDDIPRFRNNKGYTAFSEGWGLYAEYLGKEMGFYKDPYADFGRLSGEIWRAVRLVVDTGIHAMRWTEQEAVDYGLANSSLAEPAVRAEIRRYFNNPGQATAYKIGMLKILDLRARAEAELGDGFDIRAFHDTVLGAGQMPMSALESRIDAWIESVRQR